jgi:hypothetical protein
MKVSNYFLLIIVLVGYVFYFIAIAVNKLFDASIPCIIISVLYYSLFSIVFKKYRLLSFLLITFVLLSLYLSFVHSKVISLSEILNVYNSRSLPISLYTIVLLPMAFLSYTFDFFQFTREVSSFEKFSIFRFLIPILIKRELILKRYAILIDRLQSRGINSENSIVRFFRIDLWVIPLITTTLIEGIESYEYNLMLNADIMGYKNKSKLIVNKQIKVLLIILMLTILVLLITNFIL